LTRLLLPPLDLLLLVDLLLRLLLTRLLSLPLAISEPLKPGQVLLEGGATLALQRRLDPFDGEDVDPEDENFAVQVRDF